jgi:hypothetical protein
MLTFMDRAMIAEHLAQAERHVALGEKDVAEQRERVIILGRDGHDATGAASLLIQFEQLQALHVADRDRLREELTGFKHSGK